MALQTLPGSPRIVPDSGPGRRPARPFSPSGRKRRSKLQVDLGSWPARSCVRSLLIVGHRRRRDDVPRRDTASPYKVGQALEQFRQLAEA